MCRAVPRGGGQRFRQDLLAEPPPEQCTRPTATPREGTGKSRVKTAEGVLKRSALPQAGLSLRKAQMP